MPKQVWTCCKCNHDHEKEIDAIKCEEAHTPLHDLKIISFGFSSNHSWGPARATQIMCPSWVRIKFGEEHGQFALYERTQIGYKGV